MYVYIYISGSALTSTTIMDYSPSSVLVVLVVVGAGYVFLRVGWSDLVQIWTKDATLKTRKILFFHDLDHRSKSKVKYFILR